MQEMDENNSRPDPQAIVEQRKQNDGKSESKNESEDGEIIVFVYCIKLWVLMLAKALVIVIPVLVLVWMYFLPALVLRGDQLQDIEDLLYVKARIVFFYFCLYGFVSIYAIRIFGFYFTQKPLFYCVFPGFISSIFVDVYLSVLANFIFGFVVLLSIFLVRQQKLPEYPSQKLIDEFERKTEISKPLGKMALVLGAVIILFLIIYPIFLNSNFLSKLFIRFVILPIIMTCCTTLLLRFFKSVDKKHIDFLIPAIWITNGILKLYERIFTNSMSNSGDYLSFVATTFAAALIEITNHATYFHRHSIVDKLTRIISKIRNGKVHSVRTISLVPNDESQMQNETQINEFMDEHKWMLILRKKLVIEDIAIELMMIFTVTFILYFADPLIESEKVETIPSFEICIIQLLIQIGFEILSDIFGIFWSITRHKIELKTSDVEIKNRWFWVWIYFILWQYMTVFWYFRTF